jgi:hypothetical protein
MLARAFETKNEPSGRSVAQIWKLSKMNFGIDPIWAYADTILSAAMFGAAFMVGWFFGGLCR